jgi:hypothetical protein
MPLSKRWRPWRVTATSSRRLRRATCAAPCGGRGVSKRAVASREKQTAEREQSVVPAVDDTPSAPPSKIWMGPLSCQIARRPAVIDAEPSSVLIVVLIEHVLPVVVDDVDAQGTLKSNGMSCLLPARPLQGATHDDGVPYSLISSTSAQFAPDLERVIPETMPLSREHDCAVHWATAAGTHHYP